jgi:hypothetical protein
MKVRRYGSMGVWECGNSSGNVLPAGVMDQDLGKVIHESLMNPHCFPGFQGGNREAIGRNRQRSLPIIYVYFILTNKLQTSILPHYQ